MSPSPRTYSRPLAGAQWRAGLRARIYDHVFSDLRNEVGGFLLGKRDPDDRLSVTDAVPALAAQGRTASVTFTQEDWAHVHGVLESRVGDEQIVGWYHSHPGFGIFLSEFDLFIHRNFFSDAGQIAYVVDPHAGKEGVFGWRDGDVTLLGESNTARPGERPVPDAPVSVPTVTTRRWRPRHYIPAAAVGLAIGGVIGVLVFSGGGKDHSVSHGARPHPTQGSAARKPDRQQSTSPAARGDRALAPTSAQTPRSARPETQPPTGGKP